MPSMEGGNGSRARHHAAPEVLLLKRAGLRLTVQRLALAREVLARGHPTVGEVYEAIHRRYPTVGVAAVYATLNTMAERGLVRPLPFAGVMRYDAYPKPHADLVCTRCGRITVFEQCDDVLRLLREWASATAFQLQEERIELYGLCRDCQSSTAFPRVVPRL